MSSPNMWTSRRRRRARGGHDDSQAGDIAHRHRREPVAHGDHGDPEASFPAYASKLPGREMLPGSRRCSPIFDKSLRDSRAQMGFASTPARSACGIGRRQTNSGARGGDSNGAGTSLNGAWCEDVGEAQMAIFSTASTNSDGGRQWLPLGSDWAEKLQDVGDSAPLLHSTKRCLPSRNVPKVGRQGPLRAQFEPAHRLSPKRTARRMVPKSRSKLRTLMTSSSVSKGKNGGERSTAGYFDRKVSLF